jgi:putative ABC transport system permease protein
MFKHAFKLIWNRKKRNLLLMSEILFSFLVLFLVASFAISGFLSYIKPLGYSYENVWVVYPQWRSLTEDDRNTDVREILMQMTEEMESHPEVVAVSWASGNIPYGRATWSTGLKWNGRDIHARVSMTDDNFAGVLGMPLIEGRWFNEEDNASSFQPIVITRDLRDLLFGDKSAIGQTYTEDKHEYVVVGVSEIYRFHGELNKSDPGFFIRTPLSDTTTDLPEQAVIRVTDDADVRFEKLLTDRLSEIGGNMRVSIQDIEGRRASVLRDDLLAVGVTGIVAGFLVFNVALGLFGVLWYSISRRRGEIGLRRAVGAARQHISRQILYEAAVMATVGIAIGLVIAIQAPIFKIDNVISIGEYILGMASAAIMIYSIVLACAAYPSILASRIQPAEALHDE